MCDLKSILFLAFLGCVSCIHVEDIDQPPEEPLQLFQRNIGNFIVDSELYVIRREILNKEAYQQRLSLPQPLPEDDLSSETIDLSFQSLTLRKNGVIYTMGENVRFKVHQLNAEGGRIATFPKDQVAAPQKDGRSGGFVYLHADIAQGDLYISLSGEKGGTGEPGKDPDLSLRGKDGIAVFGRCGEDAYVTVGTKGEPGFSGGAGKRGGDTGNFELNISDQTKFRYHLEKISGKGGDGGMGGRGGEGGHTPNLCGMGRKPVEGDRGIPGSPGADGGLGSLCLTSHGATTCL